MYVCVCVCVCMCLREYVYMIPDLRFKKNFCTSIWYLVVIKI